jgi:hypothetical protein
VALLADGVERSSGDIAAALKITSNNATMLLTTVHAPRAREAHGHLA